MVQLVPMDAQPRDRAGKGAARAARRAGRVPCVIYGDNKDPMMISIDPQTLFMQLREPGFFIRQFEIKVNGEAQRVLPCDVQYDPLDDKPLHVDFLRINDQTQVTVDVPVQFINEEESPGLKRGGVLNVVRYEVEVVCAAGNIPDIFVADLTGLDIGDSVHISDIKLPDGVTPTITDRDFTVAAVAAPTVVAEEAAAEQAEGEEGEEGLEGEEGVEVEGAEAGEGEAGGDKEGEAKED
ncbi:MAG: 50S ribosomal protein L25/general stress protein Ctc [Alphaproteobacteria bacterium]|nr:50S ribosomal protein L25/general stress protein Ctc [Alphaproteobacteria bacterium]